MSGELVDLNAKRQERWIRQLEDARAAGRVAIFGAIGQQDADIIPFPIIKNVEEDHNDDTA